MVGMPASPQKWLPLEQKAKWEIAVSMKYYRRPTTALRTKSLFSSTTQAGK